MFLYHLKKSYRLFQLYDLGENQLCLNTFTIFYNRYSNTFNNISTVIFDFFVLFFRQSKLQRRKLLSVGKIKKHLREIIAVLQGKIFIFIL